MGDEELYSFAIDALAAGADPAAVNARIKERTRYPNVFALRMAIESSVHAQEAEELTEIAEHPVRSAMGSALQGASFGGVDELVGSSRAGRNRGRTMARAQEARETYAPGADLAAQIAGAVVPIGGPMARAATQPVRGLMSGGMRGAVRGAATGAAGGAAAGVGFAEEGERLEAGKTGATVGAAAGTVLGAGGGAIGGLLGAARGRGGRVAREMGELSGLGTSRLAAKARLEAEKQSVRATHYQPLEQQFAQIVDLPVDQFLRDLGTDPNLSAVVPRSIRQEIRRANQAGGRSMPILPTSFQDLQELRNALRSRAFARDGSIADREALARADELTELMQDVAGPALEEADRAWARVSANERALERGWQMFNKEADIIDEIRGVMTPEQLTHFDEGRLARITSKLEERNREAVGLLRQYLDAGPDTRRRVASLFPGGLEGTAFSTLENMLRSEAATAAIADFFNSSVKSAAIGVAGGAVAGGLMSRREN